MAPELQNLAHSHPNQPFFSNPNSTVSPWMWNPNPTHENDDDDSWEVRAFAEDTNNAMGTTWPPRSYTCTFCRREFRSAQALGGHMNVHRRDRARLHQPPPATSSSSGTPSTLIIPTQEFITNGGLCLFYQLPNPNPNPNGVFTHTTLNPCLDQTPSTLLSMSPFPSSASPPRNCSVEPPLVITKDNNMEEIDLELRLGHGPTPS